MSTPGSDTRRTVVLAVTLSLAGLVLLWVLYLVRHVLLILYISGLLAVGFSPIVRRLEQHRIRGKTRQRLPRWAAILILYVVLVGFVAGALALIVPPLIDQLGQLWTALPDYVDQLQRTLVRYRLITHRYTWSEMVRSVPSPGTAVGGVLGGVLGAVQSVLGAAGAIATIIVLPYYFLLEAQDLQHGFLRLFAEKRRAQVARVTHDVTLKVSAWLGGQIVLSLIIGSTAAIGLWLLGVPYFYVLALIAGVGELIPVVGPILAAIPALLVALTVSRETAVFTLVYFVVQQFVENHFLVPRVMQRQVGVSAVTVIAALLIGTELLGIVGALLAVPTAGIIQVLMQEFLE